MKPDMADDNVRAFLREPMNREALIRAGWVAPGSRIARDPNLSPEVFDSLCAVGWTPPPIKESLRTCEPGLQVPQAAIDPHVEAVREKLRTRSAAGLEKYGTDLTRTDLTRLQWLQHLQDELMDGANYVQRIMSDESSASSELEALRGKVLALVDRWEAWEFPDPVSSADLAMIETAHTCAKKLRSLPGIGGKETT